MASGLTHSFQRTEYLAYFGPQRNGLLSEMWRMPRDPARVGAIPKSLSPMGGSCQILGKSNKGVVTWV